MTHPTNPDPTNPPNRTCPDPLCRPGPCTRIGTSRYGAAGGHGVPRPLLSAPAPGQTTGAPGHRAAGRTTTSASPLGAGGRDGSAGGGRRPPSPSRSRDCWS